MNNQLQKKRNSLLITTIIIILILTKLKLINVQNIILENKQINNYHTKKQTLKITNSNMTNTITLTTSKKNAFPTFVHTNNYHINISNTSKTYFDTTNHNSFDQEFININNINFVTTFSTPFDTNHIPKYPINNQFI